MSVAYGPTTNATRKKSINDDFSAVSNKHSYDTATNNPILNIHVSCTNLPKLDIGSQSDPMVVLFLPVNGQYVEFARTEVIWNDPNPKFVKFFPTMYIFETQQPLRFQIYDVDSEASPLNKHDFIGTVDTDVQYLVSRLSQIIEFDIVNPKRKGSMGKLKIVPEQIENSRSYIVGRMSANKLKKMRTFAKNNPFFLIEKLSESGQTLPVYRSEVIPKCFQCTWKQFEVPLQSLTNGTLECPIQITVMDNHTNSPDKPIGIYQGPLLSFMESLNTDFPITNKDRKKVGNIRFQSLNEIKKPTFIDYLHHGLQLNLITSIDFTASNQSPSNPNSLHYLREGFFNQYEQCISAVGSIICPYDSDQMFPVYGFGGKINGVVDHCFPLTFDPQNPYAHGLNGILACYRQALQTVALSGPTLFAPTINAASQLSIAAFEQTKTYTILLIITDGTINDMRETVDAIVAASANSPISIIIVGVGNANFDAMDELDADEHPLRASDGTQMARDIVQFVPFRNYQNNQMKLAGDLLAEIPRQVHEFCQKRGFIPNI